jgi:glycosyltransferase involved in cell wall biosynthesis
VLLLAAACHPEKPSDFAAGWGWVRQIARFAEVVALCGAWDREGVERYLRRHGELPGVRFVFVAEGPLERLLTRRRPLFELNYLAHHLWQRRAFRVAARLFQEHPFDLLHHVTRNGFREPGFLWRLPAPFIWGPIGGTQNYPWRFLKLAGLWGGLKEGLRNLLNLLQLRFSPRVHRAARRAAVLLAANSQVQRDFARVWGRVPHLLLDTGVEEVAREIPPRPAPPPLRLLWSGVFKPHKALPLLLHALHGLPPHLWELVILGSGPEERRWRELARRLGLAGNCRWLGWLPREEARRWYDWAHLLVFTSLRDTSGNVVLEALSRGVPVLCLDHQGAGDMVTPECGVKIPVTTTREVIAGLRRALAALAENPHRLQSLSQGALARVREFLWARQGGAMAGIYGEMLRRQGRGGREEGPET